MKTFFNFCTGIALTTSLLLATTGCDRFDNIQPEPKPQGQARVGDFGFANSGFDPALFAQKIEAQLTGKVPGFGYRIIINGQPYTKGVNGGGKSRFMIDAPERNYTSGVRQDIGSCSKLMTALLVIKVLERNSLSIEEKVWKYCPSYFKPSADFKKVTFRDLLAHTSGVIKHGNHPNTKGQLADMQDCYENGIYDATDINTIVNGPLPGKYLATKPFGQYAYSNAGYGVCRVALPYLVAIKENPELLQTLKNAEGNYDQINRAVATAFRSLLRTEVFLPAGLTWHNYIDLKAWGSPTNELTKYYNPSSPQPPTSDDDDWEPASNIVNPNLAGSNNGNSFLASGSGGLYMNADEVAQVVAAMRANKIVKYEIVELMKLGDGKGNQMGFDNGTAGKHGTYYHKNGSGSGGNAVLLDFDGAGVNVQVAITTNKKGTDVSNTYIWTKLFDESWR